MTEALNERLAVELDDWCEQLQAAADGASSAPVDPQDQLAIENTIAAGVALLASEPPPQPAQTPSARPIQAQDLWITTDLVRRALRAEQNGPGAT